MCYKPALTAKELPVNFPVLYQDDHFVAIDKPSGVLVHRSPRCPDRSLSAMQILRDHVGKWVYPVHRIDRATSGVLWFAFSSADAEHMGVLFRERQVEKTYYAVVRGYAPEKVRIDRALKNERGDNELASVTDIECLTRIELPEAVGKRHTSARYSLIKASPETGRLHQIRRHLHSASHPIIGDTVHGDGHHNRFFRERYNINRLLLCAHEIKLKHPLNGQILHLRAKWAPEFVQIAHEFGWNLPA
jgi:tRNA pseudouridine65 synthase